MNKGSGELVAARKKALALLHHGVKEKDEDLHLFRELHKREKDRGVSLLMPVSEEFEANGQNSFYGMAPGKFLTEGGKNDYDWLKTPPATPLFPSLEMESTHAPELAVQRELPILQAFMKSTGNSEAAKEATPRSKSPTSRQKSFPRYSTPSGSRLSTSSAEKKNIKIAPAMNNKMNLSYSEHTVETPKKSSSTSKAADKKESQMNMNMLASNFNKSMGLDSSTRVSKPRNRGISPLVRSTIPGQSPEFSDETPLNLKTDRSLSVSRARSSAHTPTNTRRLEPIMQSSRISSSPSVFRGRKQETDQNASNSHKDKIQQGSRTQVLGSSMVDRVLHARMSNTDEKQSKSKMNTSMNEILDSRRSTVNDRQGKPKFNSSLNETSGSRRSTTDDRQGKPKFNSSLNETSGPRRSTTDDRQGKPKFNMSVNETSDSRRSTTDDRQGKPKFNMSVNETSDSRRSTTDDRQGKTRFNTSLNETSGFGRFMSKSSLDMAMKHMDYKRDSSSSGVGRRSVSVAKGLSSR